MVLFRRSPVLSLFNRLMLGALAVAGFSSSMAYAQSAESDAVLQGSAAQTLPVLPTSPVAVTDTLQSVLAAVYTSNPRLQGERSRLREIDENYIQARAQGRFNLSAGGEISAQTVRVPVTTSIFGSSGGTSSGTPKSGQVSIVQPIYQGGRIKALKSQAKASILAARAGLENAENNIFLSAANAYVDILRDEETSRIRRNNVRVLDRQLVAANDRFEVGEGTRTDIAQSESRLAVAEAGLAQADAQLEITRAQFVRLVGRLPIQPAPAPEFALPPTLDRAIQLARQNNPQLLASYYNEQAGEAAIDVARAAGRPTVSLNGTLAASRGALLSFDETDQATLAASIRIPIFSGGLNASRVRQAKHARTRLAFESRDTERAVDQTVTQIWAQLQASSRIVETSQRQVAAANVAFEGVQLEQQVGTRDQLDVLNAEQEVLNARLTLVNAERDYNSAVFQLLSIIGVFDADGIALPIEQHDGTAYLQAVSYDGYEQAIDRFVPEAAQKIAPQVPDLIVDPAKVAVGVVKAFTVDDLAALSARQLGRVGNAAKETADLVTAQTPKYDPHEGRTEIDILLPLNIESTRTDIDAAVVTDGPDRPKDD